MVNIPIPCDLGSKFVFILCHNDFTAFSFDLGVVGYRETIYQDLANFTIAIRYISVRAGLALLLLSVL